MTVHKFVWHGDTPAETVAICRKHRTRCPAGGTRDAGGPVRMTSSMSVSPDGTARRIERPKRGAPPPPDVVIAARALLEKLANITTEDFSRGGERIEREALRDALDRIP